MVKKKTNKKQAAPKTVRHRVKSVVAEPDGVYFLKLICVVLLGTLWLKFKLAVSWLGIPIGGFPLGLVVGLIGIALFEKSQIDRKIWYAVITIVAIICYFMPAGFVI